MQYPLISEYVRAIQDASNNLDELAHLVPVQDDHGEPYRSSGAFAVVFKMKDEQTGKCYALKCFTEEQEGRAEAYRQIADELEFVDSSYITSVKYLDKEIFVDSSCEEDEFPVLLMDWIDGETMETYIAENYQDNYAMAMLCYRFCKMAAWLRSQPFAHGDIKPDNIMVRPDGNLTLVDYDGMFVPAMKGQKSPTIGTKDFSHPQRTVDDFDETIDDFALASIALSLKAISLKPSLFDEYGAADRLLFSAEDYRDLSKSKVLTALQELMNDRELCMLLSIFLVAIANCNMDEFSFGEINNIIDVLKKQGQYTQEDFDKFEEAYGGQGLMDGIYDIKNRRLLMISGNYITETKTKIICDKAFCGNTSLRNITLPISIVYIGEKAFAECCSLETIILPNGLLALGSKAFENCCDLKGIVLPDTISVLEEGVFKGTGLVEFKFPAAVSVIENDAFSFSALRKIVLPKSLKKINGNPFRGMVSCLENLSPWFVLKDDVLYDKDDKIISFCSWSKEYKISMGVRSIGDFSFSCSKVRTVIISDSVVEIGNYAFAECESLSTVIVGDNVESIGNYAFAYCRNLKSVILGKKLKNIGNFAFGNCLSLPKSFLEKNIYQFGNHIVDSLLLRKIQEVR